MHSNWYDKNNFHTLNFGHEIKFLKKKKCAYNQIFIIMYLVRVIYTCILVFIILFMYHSLYIFYHQLTNEKHCGYPTILKRYVITAWQCNWQCFLVRYLKIFHGPGHLIFLGMRIWAFKVNTKKSHIKRENNITK